MARTRSTRASKRGGWRDRHGRGIRASVTGPYLPPLRTRIDVFDMTVAAAAGYLKDLWPDELAEVRFEVAAVPVQSGGTGVARWSVYPSQQRIVLYRLPIERLARLHRDDELHRRMVIESCVFRAVAELLGKDPWDLAPDRFRHY
ncbi:metallopeptidase family protein [Salinibacterium sp. SYSU T00001]|uniref:metallopeptidase family protein n=1 Tax=Homoserinimonas sedimenticola TaxID=2986805 RepID=UPI002235E683|nr:metallopeptidase family protein [Salinibacterium sedimenticola]MCW4385004.1 metallopeptidase family protein [Salinibacterium sedimenticola]